MGLLPVILLVTAVEFLVCTNGQTVANQCLAEQTRNNNNNNNRQQRQPATAEQITMASFDDICRNFREYVDCFTTRLPNGDQVADQFLRLTFEPRNLLVSYQGLCTLDLEEIRPNVRCLLSTPEVRRCYNAFNVQVNQVINLQRQGQLPPNTLEELACNASVSRYRCETAVYGFCNQRAGEIMQDFFFASVPRRCQIRTGITSRYTAIFNSSTRLSAANYDVIIVLAVVSVLTRLYYTTSFQLV